MVKIWPEPPIELQPIPKASQFEPMRPGATMLPTFERRMQETILLRVDLEFHLAQHPDIIDEAILEVDRLFYLVRGTGWINRADDFYKTFKKDTQVAKSMDDKASRDALLFRAAHSALCHLHKELHPYGKPFSKIGDFLRELNNRLEQRETERYRAAHEAGVDLDETETPAAEPTKTTKTATPRTRASSSKQGT